MGMKRRQFIGRVSGAFVALVAGVFGPPLVARAQQAKLPTIGFLGSSTSSGMGRWVAAFQDRFRGLGWAEGRNVAIEYRWADGSTERAAEIAAEFVRLKVDVIVTYGTPMVVVAKQATSAIPIVFAGAGDPVGAGLVSSLARPGGNVTGLSLQQTDAAPKRLELVREIVPGLGRLAIMAHVGSRSAVLDMKEIQTIAGTIGLQTSTLEIRRTEDIQPAIQGLENHADALYVVADQLLFTNRTQILGLAQSIRLPTMCPYREYVEAGCFISYGPDIPELFRRSAEHVDKILRGAIPGNIPVEQPTKFEMAINLKTAKALGLTVPPTLLARADEVIE
jgi:putative ABC transport system substrate-binding protein